MKFKLLNSAGTEVDRCYENVGVGATKEVLTDQFIGICETSRVNFYIFIILSIDIIRIVSYNIRLVR
jgi:hypothetical protein